MSGEWTYTALPQTEGTCQMSVIVIGSVIMGRTEALIDTLSLTNSMYQFR